MFFDHQRQLTLSYLKKWTDNIEEIEQFVKQAKLGELEPYFDKIQHKLPNKKNPHIQPINTLDYLRLIRPMESKQHNEKNALVINYNPKNTLDQKFYKQFEAIVDFIFKKNPKANILCAEFDMTQNSLAQIGIDHQSSSIAYFRPHEYTPSMSFLIQGIELNKKNWLYWEVINHIEYNYSQ